MVMSTATTPKTMQGKAKPKAKKIKAKKMKAKKAVKEPKGYK